MATTTITNNTRRDWLSGSVFTMSSDVINLALYNGSGHNANSGAYTTVNESSGAGYSPKGVVMAGISESLDTSNDVAFLDWSTDPSFATSTITATDCMIFNETVASPTVDVSMYIGDFSGSKSSSSGLFQVILPAAAFNTAVIRIA